MITRYEPGIPSVAVQSVQGVSYDEGGDLLPE